MAYCHHFWLSSPRRFSYAVLNMPLTSHICLTDLEVLLSTLVQQLRFIKSPFIKPRGKASAKAYWDIEVILREEGRKDYQRLEEGASWGGIWCHVCVSAEVRWKEPPFPLGPPALVCNITVCTWDIWCSLCAVQPILQKVNPNYLTFFSS